MNATGWAAAIALPIVLLWAVTGAYIWLRWGYVGVSWIWRRRREIDIAVESEITEGCRFHG